ncbi:DNA/RNA nuclease SfsA [Clostridium formicaceticum]|uniref:Sugar fermentation stimulation protein homolog n=1 Tax=Clostridium formicaceticum TaxID=1497 RepID=A0AAC9WHA5_9CLOT|nr:DNA/RNA nuclease SfsA [Clostridium formicaceticum]AOY77006.1 sugar fermentation stimulation protein SfsA [Clostridium formicaceticum]ARE87495.1 Sugar fermentation stimulation protein A [Clostridium formicaceticum]
MKINIEGNKIEGIFHKRRNRFIAEVFIDDKLEIAHVANTGRMKELLTSGAKVILRKVNEAHRKTQYDLLMVHKDATLISIDSRLPNQLLQQAFMHKSIPYFKQYSDIRREVNFGKSKLDFYISDQKESVLVEAKCVTLVKENKLASFPDAPTDRGRKHILELIEGKKQGFRSAVFFIVQRDDADKFTPNKEMDEAFYEAALLGKKAGVEFYAYNCNVTTHSIALKEEIEVFFN